MTEEMVEARHGEVWAVRTLRSRSPLPLRANRAQPRCQAPRARGYDPNLPVEACPTKARWCYRIGRLIVPLCLTHANAAMRAGQVVAVSRAAGICRACGCTDDDCSGCIERTGAPCSWTAPDFCSACAGGGS